MTVNSQDEADKRSPEINNSNTNKYGFGDPSGEFPRQMYFFAPTTNLAARGRMRHELAAGGGMDGLSFGLPPMIESQYPYNDVYETISGHVVEYDDTPGGERILIRHKSGSGVELRADGSIVMKTEANVVTSVAGSSALIVEGDVSIQANGNMTLKVAGDLNIDVGGNINVNAGGDKKENISGASRENVGGAKGSIVRGSRSSTTVGTVTDTALGGKNDIIKGNARMTVQGTFTQGVSGASKMTSESEMIMSTPNMNIAASDLSVFGASGTIGGAGLVHYGRTFYGTTFHGDLEGTARFAVNADITNSQTYGEASTGSALGYSVTSDATASAAADASTMDAYLNQSAYGTIKITIDEGDYIKNMIDRTADYGGVSSKTLNTREVRSKLRDPATMENSQFVGTAVSSGALSSTYSKPAPTGVDRIQSPSTGTVRTPQEPIVARLATVDRFRPAKASNVTSATVDPAFDPTNASSITPQTVLGKGITLAKFLGGIGEKVTLAHIPTLEEKYNIARQFALQTPAISMVLNNKGEFKNHRLVIVEGLYKKGDQETLTPGSLNERATRGEVVVYELHDASGKPDLNKTFELATLWKDSIQFDKLSLSYDTFDPSGELACQIILTMPPVDAKYNVKTGRFANQVETLFNNKVQGHDLIEITSV